MENTNAYQSAFDYVGKPGEAFLNLVLTEESTSVFDSKTHELVGLAALTAAKMEGGVRIHTKAAKKAGATWEEVKSAVLAALPATGFSAILLLKIALDSYNEEEVP